ncbi:hypothetical protein V1504DRAFT_463811, partial [Lipomyces starkeyi]
TRQLVAYRTHQTRREEEDDVLVVVLTLALLASLKVSINRCYLTRTVLVSPDTRLNPAIFNYVLDCGFRQAWDASTITPMSPITGKHAHGEGPLTLTLGWDWYCTI